MDHIIFMKQTRSKVVILNHSAFFLDEIVIFLLLFGVFVHVWKPCFWIFIEKNCLFTQILKLFTIRNNLYWQDQQSLVITNLDITENTLFMDIDKNIRTFGRKIVLVCSMGHLQTPSTNLKLIWAKYFCYPQHTWKKYFYHFKIFFICWFFHWMYCVQ